ncbi:hypothetical protein P3X46_014165 [Hevea brasiliensis]|uniref:DUF659 domain-containing protein n=1 Tax=Hevea brasiliensis TaxID=3981 RepID=A0ABQ9M882_HEVBR|nr:hypothetical protein P3X46_014165 [Hevea brasiliensis]
MEKKKTGEITRLKLHLANILVIGCQKVSLQVTKDIASMLKEFQDAKRDKEKRERELEEEIMNINRVVESDDDDEEDIELEMVKRESLRQFDEDAFQRRAGAHYEGGGSSSLAEVRLNVSPPSAYEISEVYLKNEYKEMKKCIASFEGIWKEKGVTIMCDGWMYSNHGTVFHKSIDASNVECKDGEYYFRIMKEVVEEIGVEKVMQVVMDNEATIKVGGKKLMDKFPNLYWTACSAHCIDLILEDFGRRKSIKKIIDQARVITQFIYNHNWVINYMKKFTDNREIIRPSITRFATNFIALDCSLSIGVTKYV